MRTVFLIVVCFIMTSDPIFSRTGIALHINYLIKRDTIPLPDTTILRSIEIADTDISTDSLVKIINICCLCCVKSPEISIALTGWLREDHPIFKGKSATDIDRFRGFLLSSLSKFPPNRELYGYVKSELLFAGHVYNVAAAAHTARNFPEKSSELIKLMEPYLKNSFLDEWVDITTSELDYPLLHPTKARYEIIQTLTFYGESAYPTVKLLDELASSQNFSVYSKDSLLSIKSERAASYIRKQTPICCQKESVAEVSEQGITMIEKKNRKQIDVKDLIFLDQEANQLTFDNLKGKPFVLAFFYTQCTNPLKCASTVGRLAQLQVEFAGDKLAGKIGIFGMTYDPDVDKPPILKKYGEMYGIAFSKNVKFLTTIDGPNEKFNTELHLRVNYGSGTVNQHGIQLFLFDKKGRLAATSDNAGWSASDAKKCLTKLAGE